MAVAVRFRSAHPRQTHPQLNRERYQVIRYQCPMSLATRSKATSLTAIPDSNKLLCGCRSASPALRKPTASTSRVRMQPSAVSAPASPRLPPKTNSNCSRAASDRCTRRRGADGPRSCGRWVATILGPCGTNAVAAAGSCHPGSPDRHRQRCQFALRAVPPREPTKSDLRTAPRRRPRPHRPPTAYRIDSVKRHGRRSRNRSGLCRCPFAWCASVPLWSRGDIPRLDSGRSRCARLVCRCCFVYRRRTLQPGLPPTLFASRGRHPGSLTNRRPARFPRQFASRTFHPARRRSSALRCPARRSRPAHPQLSANPARRSRVFPRLTHVLIESGRELQHSRTARRVPPDLPGIGFAPFPALLSRAHPVPCRSVIRNRSPLPRSAASASPTAWWKGAM